MSARPLARRAAGFVAIVLFSSAAPAFADPAGDRPAAARPNVLLYVIDTLRPDALRTYGRPGARTPHADSLGHEGMLFERGHATSSWTRASIASILTGVYPDVHGAVTRKDSLAGELALVSERFSKHGYRTGAIVTNPNVGSFYGFSQGFADFIELYERRDTGYVESREATVHSDEVTKRAIEWIDGADRPFLLFVLTIDPHWPYEPPSAPTSEREANTRLANRFAAEPGALDTAERERVQRLYQDEVEFNDASLGELLDHLRARGAYDDTIVVYTADHGEEFWEHGATQHGKTLFEENTRVPLILRYPKAVPMAVRVDRPVELVDVVPTLLELAGLPSDDALDGSSLLRATKGDARPLYGSLELDGRRLRSLTCHPWKLIWNLSTDERALYNLDLDAEEIWDLSKRHPARAKELHEALRARMAASEARRAELAAGKDAVPVPDDELPEAAREALKALGYIE